MQTLFSLELSQWRRARTRTVVLPVHVLLRHGSSSEKATADIDLVNILHDLIYKSWSVRTALGQQLALIK